MHRPSYFRIAALLIFFVGFLTRFIDLDGVSLWYDEAVTRAIVRQDSLGNVYDLLLNDPTHLPLYFSMLQPLHPESDFVLRLPNVLIGLLSIALLMRVAISLYHDYKLALLAGGLLAVNPYSIWLARTARPNALLLLVVLMASYSFFQILRGKRTWLHWVSFILSSMAAYTTHYYAAALPLAQYILFALTLRGNRRFFWQWIGAQLIAVSPLFLWWYGLTTQDAVALGIGWIPEPAVKDLGLTFWNMTVGYEGDVAWYEWLGVLAAALGVGVGLYHALRSWRDNLVDFYWFCMMIPPLLLIFAVSYVRPLYVDRYFMFALPGLLFLMLRGWQVSGTAGRFAPALFSLVCAASFLVSFANKDHLHQDWRGVVEYIQQHRQPDDALMVGDDLMLIPFYTYFEGEIPVVLFDDGPEESMEHLWLVYQDGYSDIHRQGTFPGFDYTKLPPEMRAWVESQEITLQKQFTGVMLIGVKLNDQP